MGVRSFQEIHSNTITTVGTGLVSIAGILTEVVLLTVVLNIVALLFFYVMALGM